MKLERVVASVWIPLGEAAICVNNGHEVVFSIRDRECPHCGSGNFAMLATWLQARRAP